MDRVQRHIHFLREDEGSETVHTENGYFSYQLVDFVANGVSGQEFYVSQFFVDPEKRSTGEGIKLGEQMEALAKELGSTYMSCNVFRNRCNEHNWIRRVRIFEEFGFKVDQLFSTGLSMKKILKEE